MLPNSSRTSSHSRTHRGMSAWSCRMRRQRNILLNTLLVSMLLFAAVAVRAEVEARLEKAVFCRGVDREYNALEPVNRPEITIRGGDNVCLWTRLRLNEGAYKYLQQFRRLHWTHCWKHTSEFFPRALSVGITSERWRQESGKALTEINGTPSGYFHWRTNSIKMALKPGRYEVWMHDHRKRRILWEFGDVYVDHIIVNVR